MEYTPQNNPIPNPAADSPQPLPQSAAPTAAQTPPPPPNFAPPSPEEQRAQARRSLRRSANLGGLMLILLIVLSNALSYLGLWLLNSFGQGLDSGLRTMLVQLISYASMYLIAIPVLLAIFNRGSGHRMKDLFVRPQNPPADGKFLLKWTVIGFGCTYAVNYVFNLFFQLLRAFGVELNAPSMVSEPGWLNGIITFVAFAIAAPLCEELFFRGSLLGRLRGHGEWFAILMVGILFGMTHMNYQQIFYATALGIIAGFVCVKSRSILPAILLHFSLNLVGAIQSLLIGTIDLNELTSSTPNFHYLAEHILPLLGVLLLSLLCLGMAVTGVVFLCLELTKRRLNFRLQNGCPLLTGGEKAVAFLTSPGIFLFLLMAVVMTALNAAG